MARLHIRPLTLREANEAIETLHRHHDKVRGCRFCIGAFDEMRVLRGACIVGRPVGRNTNQYDIAEVVRLATDGTKNCCSFLLGAAARVCKEMGFSRVQTFILASETGVSLKAAGWINEAHTKGGTWQRKQVSLPGVAADSFPTEPKVRYAKVLRC